METPSLLIVAQRAARVLRAFVQDHGARVRFGVRQREGILKKIRAGEVPTGYRADWVSQTTRRVLLELQQARAEFNAAYPWDAISADDLKDVVRTIYGHLET